jgi:hypothetical protein
MRDKRMKTKKHNLAIADSLLIAEWLRRNED